MFWFKICFLLSVIFVSTLASETLDFELKPAGIEQSVEHSGYGVTCKFTYFAEGGTKEHWTLSIKRSKDHKDVLCVAERPDVQSYLMFESFSLKIDGAIIKSVKIFRDHEEKLATDVYMVAESGNTVSNTESFKNEMSKLRVRAVINGHGEL